jgi:hypothetical protein
MFNWCIQYTYLLFPVIDQKLLWTQHHYAYFFLRAMMVLWLTKEVPAFYCSYFCIKLYMNITFITLNVNEGTFNLGKDASEVTCYDWCYSWSVRGNSWIDCSVAFSQSIYQRSNGCTTGSTNCSSFLHVLEIIRYSSSETISMSVVYVSTFDMDCSSEATGIPVVYVVGASLCCLSVVT